MTIVRTLLIGSLLICVSRASLACSPLPGRHYDSLPNPDMAIVHARVLEIQVTSTRATGTCLELSYSKIDTFIGTVPSHFSAQSCSRDISIEELDYTEIPVELGYAPNAVVIVGLMKLRNRYAQFRHAVPGCWGPFHMRLDHLSDEERTEAIFWIKDELARNLDQKPMND